MAAILAQLAEAQAEGRAPRFDDKDPIGAMKRNIIKGTAQFIQQYRRQLGRTGAMDFDLPRGRMMPPWMDVIIDVLRTRTRHWHVVTIRGPKGGKRIRVMWKWWGKVGRRG